MSGPRLRFVQGMVTGLLIAAGICGLAILLRGSPQRHDPRNVQKYSNLMRGIIQALVTYAAQNRDQYPAGDSDWSGVLISTGLAPVEMFEPVDPTQRGVPLFFYLAPSGSRSFATTEVLLVQNPATTDGRGGLIGYNDNHTEYVLEPEFSRLFQGRIGPPSTPVR